VILPAAKIRLPALICNFQKFSPFSTGSVESLPQSKSYFHRAVVKLDEVRDSSFKLLPSKAISILAAANLFLLGFDNSERQKLGNRTVNDSDDNYSSQVIEISAILTERMTFEFEMPSKVTSIGNPQRRVLAYSSRSLIDLA